MVVASRPVDNWFEICQADHSFPQTIESWSLVGRNAAGHVEPAGTRSGPALTRVPVGLRRLVVTWLAYAAQWAAVQQTMLAAYPAYVARGVLPLCLQRV
jgi:hypothetical protein